MTTTLFYTEMQHTEFNKNLIQKLNVFDSFRKSFKFIYKY